VQVLLDDICDNPCLYVFVVLRAEYLDGKAQFMKFLTSLQHNSPDCVFRIEKTRYDRASNMIVIEGCASATMVFRDNASRIHDIFSRGHIDPQLLKKAREIQNKGNLMKILIKGRIFWVLNEEKNKVVKIIHDTNLYGIKEMPASALALEDEDEEGNEGEEVKDCGV
jgi:hypothetical protein